MAKSNNFKFEDNSKKLKANLGLAGETAIEAAALLVEGQAKSLAPVDSGELRDKIDHSVKKEGTSVVGKVGSSLDYAIYVEYGTGEFASNGAGRKGGWVYKASNGKFYHTVGQKPQPFLLPAFRRNKQQIQQVISDKYKVRF